MKKHGTFVERHVSRVTVCFNNVTAMSFDVARHRPMSPGTHVPSGDKALLTVVIDKLNDKEQFNNVAAISPDVVQYRPMPSGTLI
uniref:SFRICE_039993 n=1 Tax=Spodoptera frugiperda TaxID=7108 RepID=A0A2H1WAA6_SPOFR